MLCQNRSAYDFKPLNPEDQRSANERAQRQREEREMARIRQANLDAQRENGTSRF